MAHELHGGGHDLPCGFRGGAVAGFGAAGGSLGRGHRLPLDALPLPRLVEVTEAAEGYDGEGLRQRLMAEAPGAVLDDHQRWRRPMAVAAARLNLLGGLSLILIAAATAAMITLAANAALAAFVRRFALRALSGSVVGAVAGLIGVALLPAVDEAGGFLTGLGFTGAGWLLPLLLPPVAAAVALIATQAAAFRTLRELP